MNLEKRVSRMEQPTRPNTLKIERVIIDNDEQIQHPERFKKVLLKEDETRKVFELEKL